jgi:hypothetical protein
MPIPVLWISKLNTLHRSRRFIERYRTCNTAEEVTKMQDTIQFELRRDKRQAREAKGAGLITVLLGTYVCSP